MEIHTAGQLCTVYSFTDYFGSVAIQYVALDGWMHVNTSEMIKYFKNPSVFHEMDSYMILKVVFISSLKPRVYLGSNSVWYFMVLKKKMNLKKRKKERKRQIRMLVTANGTQRASAQEYYICYER